METFTANFSPCTEEWQFASIQFSKSKYRTLQYITVYCDYGYNTGTVYFDDIQLTRDSLETYLSASDFVVESTGTSDDAAEEQDTTPTFNEAKDNFGNALTETTSNIYLHYGRARKVLLANDLVGMFNFVQR